jgi:hypothetical protein
MCLSKVVKSVKRKLSLRNRFFVFVLILLVPISAKADFIEGDAAHSSAELRIPEPLIFDLVRPLGAKKGELEINTLAQQARGDRVLEWAPEIEYAIADNLALELELPIENSTLTDYKIAIQGTMPQSRFKNMIHGWQVLALKNREQNTYSADALYINGYRISDKVSTLNMLGIRRTEFGSEGRLVTLINNNIFYDYSPQLTYGLEVNSEIHTGGNWRYRVVPQLHYDFSRHVTLQAGAGISKLNQSKKTEQVFAMRLIYAF